MTRRHFKMRGIVFSLFGLASLFVAATIAQFEFMALAIGLACFLIAASSFSNAGQLAPSLRPFVKRSVRVEVWGASLPATTAPLFELDSVSAVGAGLLIHLRAISGGPRTLLKVAQPGSARLEGARLEIGEARYVSWAGTKLKPHVGKPALVLLIDAMP